MSSWKTLGYKARLICGNVVKSVVMYRFIESWLRRRKVNGAMYNDRIYFGEMLYIIKMIRFYKLRLFITDLVLKDTRNFNNADIICYLAT